jgi:hypothetical protein
MIVTKRNSKQLLSYTLGSNKQKNASKQPTFFSIYPSFVFIQDGQAQQVFRPAMTNPEEIRKWVEKEFDIEHLDASTEIITQSIPQTEDITIARLPSSKRKIHSYLETINIEWLIREAHKEKSLSRDLSMRFWVSEKRFPELKSLFVELGMIEVKEGVVAKISPDLSLDELLLRAKDIKNNQE